MLQFIDCLGVVNDRTVCGKLRVTSSHSSQHVWRPYHTSLYCMSEWVIIHQIFISYIVRAINNGVLVKVAGMENYMVYRHRNMELVVFKSHRTVLECLLERSVTSFWFTFNQTQINIVLVIYILVKTHVHGIAFLSDREAIQEGAIYFLRNTFLGQQQHK